MSRLGKPNRLKKRDTKKGKFWCENCDRFLVIEWKKCPVCGYRNGIKRFRKGEYENINDYNIDNDLWL